MCDVRFWRENKTNEKKKHFLCCCQQTIGIELNIFLLLINEICASDRSQSNDGKKGKKRTTTESSSRSNHSSSSKAMVTSNHARNHKSSKANTKNNINLSNNDNNGAGSLSIGSGSSVASSNVHSSTNSTHTTSTATTQSPSAIVKLSPAPSSTGSARTSSPIVNVTILKKYRDEPSTSRTPDMPFGSVPTAGGLKFGYESQQPQQAPSGLVISTSTTSMHVLKESPPSSPGSEASARKRRKGGSSLTPLPSPHGFHADHKEKDTKTILQNGAIPVATHHMLGNQLNPNSTMAKNMTETLNMEIEAHSIYTHEPVANLVGPQYPGRKDTVSCSYHFVQRF